MANDLQFYLTTPPAATQGSVAASSYPSDPHAAQNPDQPMPPYGPSAPDELYDPKAYFGNDVYSKTYLILDWMKNDPDHSTNDAEVFLLFLSGVCTVAHEENSPYAYNSAAFNQYAAELLCIKGPNGKSLIDECVDITMDQLVLNGQSPEEAAVTIEKFFPYWPPGDPITNEVRSEADTYYKTMDPNPTQDEIENEWEAFITDDSTIAGIDQFEAENPPSNAIPMNPDQPMPPYDPTAPGQMFRPGSVSGNDVLSKSYLWLDWMEKNPSNTNGAEVFLLYTSNLAQAGYFGDDINGNALSTGLLSIQNSQGKTLVAECVDITMEQMVVSGMSTQAAEDQIDALFPGNDPVSVAVRNEADLEQKKLQTDIDNGHPPTQQGLEDEWYAFMTDPATTGSIDAAKSDLMGAMIMDCDNNVYLALVALLLLLDAAGMNSLDAYGALSDELADETDQLNTLITEWDDAEQNGGFETAEEAQQWMDDLQNLQNEMDATPFDEQTHELIDKQFQTIYDQQAMGYNSNPPQKTYSNGDPMYVDANGNYVNSDGQRVDQNGNTLYTQSGKDAPSGGQTVYYNPDTGEFYPEGSSNRTSHDSTYKPQMGTGEPQPVYDTSKSAESNPASVNYSNGTPMYTDSSGNSVNSSGQKVNENGYPLYTSGGSTYYYKDGTYYNQSTNQPMTGTGSFKPVMGSGEDVTPVTTDSNLLYVDSTGQTYYKQDDGTYINADTGSVATPTGDVKKLTIGDQAYGNDDYNYEGDSEGLQKSFEAFQPQPVNPDNPNNTGGVPLQEQAIDSSLNALISPLSQQTSAVGAEMQQAANWIELVDNTFSATLLDNNTGYAGTMSAINDNLKA